MCKNLSRNNVKEIIKNKDKIKSELLKAEIQRGRKPGNEDTDVTMYA